MTAQQLFALMPWYLQWAALVAFAVSVVRGWLIIVLAIAEALR